MTKVKQGLLIFLGVMVFLLLLSPRANPDSPELYKVKRLQEKMFFFVQRTPSQKASYYLRLLDLRAQELQALVSNKSYDYILQSSLRYSTTAGNLAELIRDQNLSDYVPRTLEKFKSHQSIFQDLLTDYPTEDNPEWKFIQDDINYLTIYTGFINK